jgi:hypothetical protein
MHARPDTALWNPTAITLWSVPFSPLFGAWLHIHNWTALGEPAKADAARRWFNALLIVMVFNGVITAIAERVAMSVNPADFISIAVFLLWYGLAAHPHARAVRARTGARYARRSWDGALLAGVAAGLAFYGYSRLTCALLAWCT